MPFCSPPDLWRMTAESPEGGEFEGRGPSSVFPEPLGGRWGGGQHGPNDWMGEDLWAGVRSLHLTGCTSLGFSFPLVP